MIWADSHWVLRGAIALTLSIPGCAQEQESLIIARAPLWPDDGVCLIDPEADTSLWTGKYDVAFNSGYLLPLDVRSRLQEQQPGQSNSGTDNSELQLIDADVKLRSSSSLIDKLAARDPRYVEFTVPLAAASLSGGGALGVAVDVFSPGAAIDLRAALIELNREEGVAAFSSAVVLAEVVVNASRSGNYGDSRGGIASRAFTFPVEVCLGCLCVSCAAASCPALGPDGYIGDGFFGGGGVCGNAQDRAIQPYVCSDEAGDETEADTDTGG